jgi:hypothetical protein
MRLDAGRSFLTGLSAKPRSKARSEQGEHDMYKVYTGPSGSDRISPLEKQKMLFKEFPSIDQAFSWASHISDTGRAALLIEGDDGTHLTKDEIAAALRHLGGKVADKTGVQ